MKRLVVSDHSILIKNLMSSYFVIKLPKDLCSVYYGDRKGLDDQTTGDFCPLLY